MRIPGSALRTLLAASLVAMLAVGGCTSAKAPATGDTSGTPGAGIKPAPVRIGTLATQDSLPLWVAEEKGYFAKAGLASVQIVPFQSAVEEQAAFMAGAVDMLMTDLIVATDLRAAGTKVIIPTVMLGADTAQGRFAIVGAPKTSFKSMGDLKNVPVGTSSSTITEYVLDKLMEEAGVPAAGVKKEEVKKMPVRFELLMTGQLKAAALPEPFVTLAEQQGAHVVPGGDDTKATENLSQSVLCVNQKFAVSPGGAAALKLLLGTWDQAVADINASPDSFRQTLVSKARLPEPLAGTYNVGSYPKVTPPSAADIQKVLDWMTQKGYLKTPVTPQDLLEGK